MAEQGNRPGCPPLCLVCLKARFSELFRRWMVSTIV